MIMTNSSGMLTAKLSVNDDAIYLTNNAFAAFNETLQSENDDFTF